MAPPLLPLIAYPGWLIDLLRKSLAWGSGGTGPAGSATNPLTAAQAQALFDEMAGQTHIPFNWPADGCFARAHEMRRLMAEKGIEAHKYWNHASPGKHLEVTGTSIGTVLWGWHVAPAVMVQGPHGPQPMMIDPSLFPGPVTPQEWAAKQGDPRSILQPADGETYKRNKEGSWSEEDTDYAKTREDLEYYRAQRETWDLGIDPRDGSFRPWP
jgi:hypothetical protein